MDLFVAALTGGLTLHAPSNEIASRPTKRTLNIVTRLTSSVPLVEFANATTTAHIISIDRRPVDYFWYCKRMDAARTAICLHYRRSENRDVAQFSTGTATRPKGTLKSTLSLHARGRQNRPVWLQNLRISIFAHRRLRRDKEDHETC